MAPARGRNLPLRRGVAATLAWFVLLTTALKFAAMWVFVVSDLQSRPSHLSPSDAPYILAMGVLHAASFVLACGFLVRLQRQRDNSRVRVGNLLLAIVLLEVGSYMLPSM